MAHNPYAPPKAYVQDVLPEQAVRVRPRQVVLAVQLGVLGYVLGIVALAISWDHYSKLMTVATTVGSQLFGLALIAWIYYKIYMGRNWARVTLLVFCIIGTLGGISGLFMSSVPASPVISKVQMFVGIGINGAILWLLFFSPGRVWFQKQSAA